MSSNKLFAAPAKPGLLTRNGALPALTLGILVVALLERTYYPGPAAGLFTVVGSDSALFEYFGRAMIHGQRLYVDLFDNKLPSIFLINALWQRVFGERYWLHSLAQMVVTVFSAVALFALLVRRAGVYRPRTATFCFALTYTLLPGSINWTESYATPLILASVLAEIAGRDAVAALCVAAASTFWIPACIMLVPIVFYAQTKRRQGVIVLSFIVSLAAYVALVIAVLAVDGAELVRSWLRYVVNDNPLPKAVSNQTFDKMFASVDAAVVESGIGIWLAALAAVLKRPRTRLEWFGLLWIVCALAGALVSGRFYPHYYLPLVPALLFGVCLFPRPSGFLPVRALFVALMLVLAWRTASFRVHQVGVDIRQVGETADVARRIDRTLGRKAIVEIDGYAPQIFLAADALPVGRLGVAGTLRGYVHTGRRNPAVFLARANNQSPAIPAGFHLLCAGRSLYGWQFYGPAGAPLGGLCSR